MTGVEESFEDKVQRLAAKLMREGRPEADTPEAAEKVARRLLEESEERTNDPATMDPESDEVIRRSSRETASDGSSGAGGVMRSTGHGD